MNFDIMNAHYGRYETRPQILEHLPKEQRKVITRSTVRVIGRFPSYKCRRHQPWEAENELLKIMQLEYDITVAAYSMQPAWLPLVVHGESHEHCPDILVIRTNGIREYIEVKLDADAARPDVQARTEAAKLYCSHIGYGYSVAVESEIKVKLRLTNADLQFRNAKHHVSRERRFEVLNRFEQGAMAVQEFMDEFGVTFPWARVELTHLAAWHHLVFNQDEAITPRSIFSLPE